MAAGQVSYLDCDIETASCHKTTYLFNTLPLDFALPFFTILIVVELALHFMRENKKKEHEHESKHQLHTPYYRLNDALSSLSCGVAEQILSKLVTGYLSVYTYSWFYHYYRVFDLPTNPQQFSLWWFFLHTITFLLKDHQYYWFHRLLHEINLFWSAHCVHHSSEEYNLTTALRQGHHQSVFSWMFYIPVAMLGISPEYFAFHTMINLLYQFWIHTRVVDKFPAWIEFIFNTPSHHRVHHGANPYCIDMNYGGTLIVWDRLYGTFTSERDEEPVVYGLVHPLQTFNPVHTETHHLSHIFQTAVTLWNQPSKALGIVFRGPGWNHVDGSEYPLPPKDHTNVTRYDPQYSVIDTVFRVLHFCWVFFIAVAFMFAPDDHFYSKLGQYLYCYWMLASNGYMSDQHRGKAVIVEFARALFSVALALGLISLPVTLVPQMLTSEPISSWFMGFNVISLVYMVGYYGWQSKPKMLSKYHDHEHQPVSKKVD